jgi:type IX secretion system PorP/SprF family membrane protein
MKKLIILGFTLFQLAATAQQDIMVSQYMFNGLILNPAYAGSRNFTNVTALHRSQWVGFSGAPRTTLIAVDGPIHNNNMGLGLIVSNDRIGAVEQTDIFGNYAYQLRLSRGKLAFGVKAGVSNYVFKNHNLTTWDDNDVVLNSRRTIWLPKFGFGMYYSNDTWYGGFSIPTLLGYDPNRNFSADVNTSTFLRRHYNLYGGVLLNLSEEFKIKPSLLVKYVPTAPVQADINANLFYKDRFMFGAGYRTGDAVTLMAQYTTNSHILVGYAYDFTTSKLRKYSYGSHEIMVGYEFGHKDPSKSVSFF